MAITVQMRTEVSQLYVALFGRAPEGEGLGYWVGELNAGKTVAQVADAMYATTPARTYYPSFLTNQEIIANFYVNVLGRTADAEGLAYWTAKLNATGATPGKVIAEMISIVANYTGTDAAGIKSANLFNNKVSVAQWYGEQNGGVANATAILATVTDDAATVTAVKSGSVNNGETVALTTGVDNYVGTNGNDTINAVLNGASSTLTALDTIDGGAGADTLNIQDLVTGGSAFPAGLTVKNVEIVSVRAADDVAVNTATWTGVNKVAVAQSVDATITAGATTAVEVTGATGAIAIDGGSTQTVSAATANQAITLGATTGAAGAISVTHTKQGTGAIAIDGGTTVNVTASGVTTGGITIGATDAASGAVVVNSTGAASVAATDVTLGAIAVTGGTTVTVNQVATSSSAEAAADTTGATITQSAVTITGDASTTTATVTQSAAVAEVPAITAVAGANETQTVTFVAMAAGETTVVNGLTFTASKALTAAKVAAAFANLTSGTTQGFAPASDGIYSGTFSTIGGSTGAVTTTATASTVTFTSTAKADVAALTVSDTAAAGNVSVATVADGSAATAATTGVLGVVGGAVTINGAIAGADVLATVTLDGFGAASTVASDALTTLNLAHSNEDVTVTTTATTLALGLNGAGIATNGAAANLGATYTTLNVSTSGAASYINLTAGGVTALNVSGDKAAVLTGSTLGALKTVTVTGAAGVTLDASGATVTSVNASGTSGNNTFTVDATKATYTGGTGVDSVTLSAAAPTKAVSLGAGNDSLTLAAGTTSSTAVLSGGDGTDTLVMASANAATASAATTFETFIDGFERLSLGAVAAAATDTIDLANMDDISYVISAGVGAAGTLNLDNMASGGTLSLTGAGVLVDVDLVDATGTADSLNLITTVSSANLAFGTVDAAGIESMTLTANDTQTNALLGQVVNTASLTLKDAALASLVVSGNSNVTLTLDANVVALASLDATALTGALTASTNGTVAQTILGGSGADVLTANGSGDILNGGAGADTLIVADNLVTLTGGAGADIFNVGYATTNVNSYATITDLAVGDKIKFTAGALDFMAAQITLADTAVFQDYANYAVANTDTGDVSWFQFNGNTYVIENVSDNASAFVNGSDIIVKIAGTVNLSAASFNNNAADTLLII